MEVVRFDDFDACATALRSWELEAVQLDRGSFWGELIQARSTTTLVTEGTFGRKLHQTGEPPRGLRTIVVPADRVALRLSESVHEEMRLSPQPSPTIDRNVSI
jgi:hypothetical protein